MENIFQRLKSYLRIFIYFFIFLSRSIYILLLITDFFISLRIKRRISIYRVKKYMNKKGFKTGDIDIIAEAIVGKYPSIIKIYKTLRKSMG